MPRRIYPTIQETIETQKLLIEEFGGPHGIRDRSPLESAVFRPRSGYYGNIFEEANALMESLSNNRAFFDDRKRTSWAMTDSFLRVNGYFIDVDPFEAYRFMKAAISRHEFRSAEPLEWISANAKEIGA